MFRGQRQQQEKEKHLPKEPRRRKIAPVGEVEEEVEVEAPKEVLRRQL